MLAVRFLQRSATTLHYFENPIRMAAKKIVDTFNEIDKELVYVKNKLDSLNDILGTNSTSKSTDAVTELQRLKDENKTIQKDMLEIMKQIAVHQVLRGQPPLALKVFLQNQKVDTFQQQTPAKTETKPATAPEQQAPLASTNKATPEVLPTKQAGDAPVGKPDKTDKKKPEKNKDAPKDAKPAPPGDAVKKDDKEKDVGGDEAVTVARLDFRVGKIVQVEKHPDAESLYVEKIDLGEGQPRTIVSGLVKFVPIEQMQDRMVVVLCNLKPAKMRGVNSEGMVMCASTPEKVEVLEPPKGSQPGDRVTCAEFPGTPDAQLNPKKKIWETVAPELAVSAAKVACYKGLPLIVVGKGNVVSQSLTGCPVK